MIQPLRAESKQLLFYIWVSRVTVLSSPARRKFVGPPTPTVSPTLIIISVEASGEECGGGNKKVRHNNTHNTNAFIRTAGPDSLICARPSTRH